MPAASDTPPSPPSDAPRPLPRRWRRRKKIFVGLFALAFFTGGCFQLPHGISGISAPPMPNASFSICCRSLSLVWPSSTSPQTIFVLVTCPSSKSKRKNPLPLCAIFPCQAGKTLSATAAPLARSPWMVCTSPPPPPTCRVSLPLFCPLLLRGRPMLPTRLRSSPVFPWRASI